MPYFPAQASTTPAAVADLPDATQAFVEAAAPTAAPAAAPAAKKAPLRIRKADMAKGGDAPF